MATYTHHEIAVPGGVQWFNVTIDGNNPITRTSTLFVLPNSDGTETHIIGTDFMYDADGKPTGYWYYDPWFGDSYWVGGWITQIDRTSSDGATVYETIIPDLDPVSVFAALTSTPNDGNRSSFPFIFDFGDTFNGFSGDDVFGGVGFGDSFDGGSGGTDTVSYGDAFYAVRADLGNPATNTGDAAGDTYTSIENLTGSDFADWLFGNSSVNVFSGGLGNDFLDGKAGDDTMIGGAGDDIYLVDSTSDLVTENAGEGNDIVFASVDYTIGPNIEGLGRLVSGDDTMIGGAGDDFYLVDSTSGLVNENLGEGNDTVYTLVDYTIGLNIEGLVLVEGTGNINGSGNNLNNVLAGNSGNNVLDGKGGDDTMIGGAGDDRYYVDSTGDLVTENPDEGFELVYASVDYTIGPNIEQLVLFEGAGNINGSGNNTDNYLQGNSGNNTLIGGDGRDSLAGAGGGDTMIGGAGDDLYSIDSTSDVVIENLDEGHDGVFASLDYTLGPNIEYVQLTGYGNLNAVGNDLNNSLMGGPGNNTLIGGLGDDTLRGGDDIYNGMEQSDDTLIGGAGNDTYYVDSTGDLVTEKPGEGSDTVYVSWDYRLGPMGYTLGPNIENLTLLNHWNAINGSGNSLNNALVGNYVDNVLDGKGGDDTLIGGPGDDTLIGGAGNDVYFVEGPEAVFESAGEGIDTVYASGHFRLPDNVENLILQADTAGRLDVQGYGNGLSNAIYGTSGNNILNGEAGADAMYGGAGNDAYFVDHFADAAFENAGEGTDTVYASAHYRLGANVEHLVLQGTADLQGYGNDLANAIFGSSGNDLLDGGADADWLSGGQGNDAYFVDNPGDAVTEKPGEGMDTVYASAHYRLGANLEYLVLQGTADLQGYGNEQSNAIYGNSGRNIVNGGGGPDMLTGGAGNDAFIFEKGQAHGDFVMDFSPGDSLVFVGYDSAAEFHRLDNIRWEVLYDGGASHEIINFMNSPTIHQSDFYFMG